jgi:hypothetical protein
VKLTGLPATIFNVTDQLSTRSNRKTKCNAGIITKRPRIRGLLFFL